LLKLGIVFALYAKENSGQTNLAPLDLETKATTQKRGKEARKKKKEAKMTYGEEHMVLCDFAMPKATRADSSIVRTIVEAHKFELKPALVVFVKGDLFGRHPSENPNMHLRNFLTKYDTIKLNGPSNDVIWLRLFHSHSRIEPVVGYRRRCPTPSLYRTPSRKFSSRHAKLTQDPNPELNEVDPYPIRHPKYAHQKIDPKPKLIRTEPYFTRYFL